jgi:SAM-dependent MidA family methyltransferase
MAEAAERSGMRVAGFATQAAFLMGCGLLDLLADVGATDSIDYLRAASAVQTLVSPSEMGELFKALLLVKGKDEFPSLAVADMAHRL